MILFYKNTRIHSDLKQKSTTLRKIRESCTGAQKLVIRSGTFCFKKRGDDATAADFRSPVQARGGRLGCLVAVHVLVLVLSTRREV
jgi:hypothetical protein